MSHEGLLGRPASFETRLAFRLYSSRFLLNSSSCSAPPLTSPRASPDQILSCVDNVAPAAVPS